MPIQSEGHVPTQISEPSGFWMQLPKAQKYQNNIFDIWYDPNGEIRSFSVAKQQLLNSNRCLRFGWRWDRDRRVCTALHYNQKHTILLSLWMQWPIRDLQMSYRWNAVFSSLACWLNYLANSLIRNNKVQMCVQMQVRYSFHSVNSFSDFNGSFWKCLNSG